MVSKSEDKNCAMSRYLNAKKYINKKFQPKLKSSKCSTYVSRKCNYMPC